MAFTVSTVLEPDVMFVSRARLHIVGEKSLTGPPDLVVEVLSESTAQLDGEIKPKQYALYGVPEFWTIDPLRKTIEVFGLEGGEYELRGKLGPGELMKPSLLPGLTLPVADLWEN